jgi:hypothetical protein
MSEMLSQLNTINNIADGILFQLDSTPKNEEFKKNTEIIASSSQMLTFQVNTFQQCVKLFRN